jgi:hypothetical protein
MGIHNNAVVGASGQQGYQIQRSVRLRSSASAYLNRTPASASNRTTWTWNAWIKRGGIGATDYTLFSAGTSATDTTDINFSANSGGDVLLIRNRVASTNLFILQTTPVYRDPAAWYMVTAAFDTTQATAADRFKLYVNGVQVTVFSTATYGAQNSNTYANATNAHRIGANAATAAFFDGYLTEINFIDGQALTPSSFGETNAVTGVWQPKKYGGTYGTNVFYLNFSDNSASTAAAIGKDYSGNGNNWTPNIISVTAGATYDSMLDSPTPYNDGGNGRGNYPVWNVLGRTAGNFAMTNGNLTATDTGSTNSIVWATMFLPTSGKWYWEITNVTGSGLLSAIGAGPTSYIDSNATSATGFYRSNGQIQNVAGTNVTSGNSYTNGDIIGIAVDVDAGTMQFYKNNVAQGTTPSATFTAGTVLVPFGSGDNSVGTKTFGANFGQQPFTYTPPTGFKALNTQNLPIPTILNGANYMAATTYTGTGGAMSVSNEVNGKSFQPDWVWIKQRNGIANHVLGDAVRGVSNYIFSNLTNAEATATAGTGITAFSTNGFTLGTETTTVGSVNASGGTGTYVGWQWNAGGSTVTNTSGSISAQVRANPTAGFSVVTGTFPASGTSCTFGHGLGVAPSMIISKGRDGGTSNWIVRHTSLGNMTTKYLEMNGTAGVATGPNAATAPSLTLASVSTDGLNNNMAFVAYCFSAVAGYSAFGKYTGNNSADGPFVYLGFRPRWVMFKDSSTTGVWMIMDTARNTYNVLDDGLAPNNSNAESTYSNVAQVDFLSNGFKIRAADAQQYWNNKTVNSNIYIYAAFAENPFKNSLAR